MFNNTCASSSIATNFEPSAKEPLDGLECWYERHKGREGERQQHLEVDDVVRGFELLQREAGPHAQKRLWHHT